MTAACAPQIIDRAVGHRVSSPALIGRDVQLRMLDAALAAALESRPQIALIIGEAGVGKTRLTGELEARARGRGFVVLHGEAVEFGGDEFAYAPVVAALRGLPDAWVADHASQELAVLLPRVRRGPEPAPGVPARFSQGRVCELLLQFLGGLADDESPLLIVFEDLHWADRSTRDLIAFLVRNLSSERIAIGLTYRTGELPAHHPLRRLLAELARHPAVHRLELLPLSRDEVARQVEEIAEHPVAATIVDELHDRAGGNPFFVEELFVARREGAIGLPATLTDTVQGRVGRLGEDAQQLLAVIAAAGGRISDDVLERVMPHDAIGPALRAASDARVVMRDRSDEIVFRHALIGEVVYGSLVPGERRPLHSDIARALADTGAPAAHLAHQWHRAGAAEEALTASVEAGLEAVRLCAFAEARPQFERALDLWDTVAPAPGALPLDRVELLSRAAQASRFTGERRRAVALGRQALAEVDHRAEPLRAAVLYERLGESYFWDDATALDFYGQALQLLPETATSERARVLAAQGHALMGLRRWRAAREHCEFALAAARECADEAAEASARITLGLVLAYLGDMRAGEAHLRRALEVPGGRDQQPRAYLHLGELLRLRGDHASALEAMTTGERAAARLGMRNSFGHFMYVNGADDLFRLGRWDEAEQRLIEAERLDLDVTGAALHHAIAGHLNALRGDEPAAREHLEQALLLVDEPLPAEFVAPLRTACASLSFAEHDAEGARGHIDCAFEAIGDEKDLLYTPPLHWLGVRAAADLAERARSRRDPEGLAAARNSASALLADLAAIVERAGAAPPAGLAYQELAMAENARLVAQPAAERWAAAASAFSALRQRFPAAYARWREAESRLAAGGGRAAAADALMAAHAAAVELRARPLRDDVEALARRARIALPAPDAAPPSDLGHDEGLTAREADVLQLLAEGLTNREISGRLYISQKTVGTHVAHIFEKLDVHTRVEAAGRAQQLGMLRR